MCVFCDPSACRFLCACTCLLFSLYFPQLFCVSAVYLACVCRVLCAVPCVRGGLSVCYILLIAMFGQFCVSTVFLVFVEFCTYAKILVLGEFCVSSGFCEFCV